MAENPELMKWEPEYFVAWSASVKNVLPWPTVKQAESLMSILVEEQGLAASGSKSIEEALASIESRWNAELAK